jgi:hypothetical protein
MSISKSRFLMKRGSTTGIEEDSLENSQKIKTSNQFSKIG